MTLLLIQEKYFHMYAQYTHNKPKSDKLMSECGNEFFKARQRVLEDKMDLSSYLLRPVQRMGKYALLLKQLLKVYPRSEPEWEKLQVQFLIIIPGNVFLYVILII